MESQSVELEARIAQHLLEYSSTTRKKPVKPSGVAHGMLTFPVDSETFERAGNLPRALRVMRDVARLGQQTGPALGGGIRHGEAMLRG
jgi:hypothetical protein